MTVLQGGLDRRIAEQRAAVTRTTQELRRQCADLRSLLRLVRR